MAKHPFITLVVLLTPLICVPSTCFGQQPSPGQIKFFETKIRPALVKYCYECHSVEAGDSRGGLLVDTRIGLMQGGDAGPALVPGDAEASLLWEAINWEGYEMPPSEKMPASVLADFKTWIDMGAPDPRVREITRFTTKITKQDIEQGRREHWSFQPPRSDSNQTIDRLVAAKLNERGLRPAESADGYTLLRRIYFDLVGLPPTPAEINRFQTAFRADPNKAIQAKVDQLLQLPQYGERWGRHWLDVARYAESSGSRNTPYPHAWRYRDYVIDSFNEDTPYDRFITEQVAGDLLPAKTDEQWQKNLIATGFLAIGLKHHDEKNPRKFMSDMVDEQIDTTTQAVLGLTVACARCHDHKYDPIPTDDYYSLAGIFYSTKTYYGTARIAQNHRPSDLLLLPIQDTSTGGSAENRRRMESMEREIANLDQQMRGVGGKDRRGLRNTRNRIATQLASLNPDGSAKAFGMGVQDADRMVNANILFGGEVEKPAQEVPRGFVQILGDLNFTPATSKSGRLELAKAMTSKSNPLAARVMVNRIWMHLIGKPLVETPSNFGFNGMEPSNQALLDHLAVRFMKLDWSVKDMIREIVLSETYRRSSRYIKSNYAIDPDNKFLWRANPRQLAAESLRDAMLSVSGGLNLDRPQRTANPGVGGRRGGSASSNPHRSVYLPVDRSRVPESLELFGFPDPNVTSPGRSESIVPTQALYLMNDDFVVAQSQGLAATLEANFSRREDQIRMAILWAYGRPATTEELAASLQFFDEFRVGGTSSTTNAGRSNTARPAQRRPDDAGDRLDQRRVGMSSNESPAGRRNQGGGLRAGGRAIGAGRAMGAGRSTGAGRSMGADRSMNAGGPASTAENFTAQQVQFYEQQVKPILVDNCLRCHGEGRVRGGLQLSNRNSLLRGGQSGSAINFQTPDESMLLKVVNSGSMPPNGKLSSQQIRVLSRWVEMKAPFDEAQSNSVAAGPRRRGGLAGGPGGPGGGGMGRGPAGRGRGRPGINAEPVVGPPTTLAVFCQTLLQSASFRILD